MSKPHGVRIAIGERGLDMYVPRITRTEDKIWEAVEEAIAEGWTAERFRREAAVAPEDARSGRMGPWRHYEG